MCTLFPEYFPNSDSKQSTWPYLLNLDLYATFTNQSSLGPTNLINDQGVNLFQKQLDHYRIFFAIKEKN